MTRLQWLTVALLAGGGLLYADWVLQLVLPVEADLRTSFISELSAASQPWHVVFRVTDVVDGAMIVSGALLAWGATRCHSAVWAPLILLGACTLFQAAVPLTSAYTFGAALPPPGTGSWWAKVSEPHGVASFLESTAFLVALLTGSRALRQAGADPRVRRVLATIGVAAAIGGVAAAVLTASLLLRGDAIGIGAVQRLAVTLTAVWLALAPARLLTLDPDGRGPVSRCRAAGASPRPRAADLRSSNPRD